MIRALIVDDEAPARARMRELLSDWPVTVAGEASDGYEALDRAAALQPDVVFLDIQMPGLSGLEVAARLPAPRPRIIFCTAFDQYALEAFEHHAVAYLLKPVARERLGRVLDRVLDDAKARRQRERERQDAMAVQAGLMPGDISVGGLDCAARCVPADGVGGDFYDVLPMDGDRVGLMVGDVSGKGLYAGILAAAVQGRLQSLVARGGNGPAALLDELNRLSTPGLEAHRFVTLALVVHDAASSSMTYAAAGHPPGLLLRTDGSVEHLHATGPVIGWPGASFSSRSLPVRSGDLVALYSDGISESSAPGGQELGADGLASILRRRVAEPAARLVGAVLDDLERFTGGAAAADDRTLLVGRIA